MSDIQRQKLRKKLRLGTAGRIAVDDDDTEPGWGFGFWAVLVADVALIAFMLVWLPRDSFLGPARDVWFAVTISALGVGNFLAFFARTGAVRSALAASTFLVWVVMFAMVTNIEDFRNQLEGNDFVKSSWDLFHRNVAVLMAFYFGSEAVVQGVKLWQGGRTLRTAARLGDPDARAALRRGEIERAETEK